MKQRVLVTNDDGIDSDGLRVLTAALVDHGYEPLVIAPDSDYSGAGSSLLAKTNVSLNSEMQDRRRELRYERRTLGEAPDVEAYAVAAPPAMCTLLAMRGGFGDPPAAVTSGINLGLNTGPAVKHSGTVAAALTAGGYHIPALALSAEFVFEEQGTPPHWQTAAAVGMQLLPLMLAGAPQVVNLNVPAVDLEDLAGVRSAPLATTSGWYSMVDERTDDALLMSYHESDAPVDADSDTAQVKAGFASVTVLNGTTSGDGSDLIAALKEAAA